MNLFSGIAAAGRAVAGGIGAAVKKVAPSVERVAREQLSGELQRLKEAGAVVRTAVTDASNMAREAAADAIFKGAVGAGAELAGRVGPQGNAYQRASAFLDTPEKRTLAMVGAAVLVLLLLFLAYRAGGR